MKRLEVKYVRDGCKAEYDKDNECYICKTNINLELHHYYSLTPLWNKWKQANGINITSVDDVLKFREIFKEDHFKEIYEEVVTLCKYHHMDKLHKIYGKTPALHTAKKQMRWVEIQRRKLWESKVSQ